MTGAPPEQRAAPRRPGRRRRLLVLLAGLVVATFCAAGLFWIWPETWRWLEPERLTDLLASVTTGIRGPGGALVAVAAIVLLGLIGFPITVMVLAVGLAFSPPTAIAVTLVGILLSAGVLFALGRVLGRRMPARLAGGRAAALSRRLARGGAATVAALRNVPILPFTVMNLICGASALRFRDYLIGTVLGMAPGTVALCLLGDRAAEMLRHPTPGSLALLALAALGTALLARLVQRAADRLEARAGAGGSGAPESGGGS